MHIYISCCFEFPNLLNLNLCDVTKHCSIWAFSFLSRPHPPCQENEFFLTESTCTSIHSKDLSDCSLVIMKFYFPPCPCWIGSVYDPSYMAVRRWIHVHIFIWLEMRSKRIKSLSFFKQWLFEAFFFFFFGLPWSIMCSMFYVLLNDTRLL